MTPLVPIALFGFIPFVFLLFASMRPRRAVIAAYVAGWLFLPMASYPVPGLPDYTKVSAISYSVFLATLVFDKGGILRWRPQWYDIPMGVWVCGQMITSVMNGLGVYDGVSSMFGQFVWWGVPYLVGRVYFREIDAFRDLAIGVVIGGLLYVPLCWTEIMLSPQLHRWVYGFHQHQFAQSRRGGGFRPVLFMQHGLAVGMWMTAATLTAYWLWLAGKVKKLYVVPMIAVVLVLLVTAIFVKSVGALTLLVLGMVVLTLGRMTRTRVALVMLVSLPLLYVGLRGTGLWDGHELIEISEAVAGEGRADSLAYRLHNENLLIGRALEQPIYGWGGWGRSRPQDAEQPVVTDGLWTVALGQNGLMGLAGLFGALHIGIVRFIRIKTKRLPPAAIKALAAPEAVGALLALNVIDCLFNGMVNPIFTVSAGGLAALSFSLTSRTRAPQFRPAPGIGRPVPGTPLVERPAGGLS